jgi:hypothetical protein
LRAAAATAAASYCVHVVIIPQVFTHGQPSSQCTTAPPSSINVNLVFANNSHQQSHVTGQSPAAALFLSSEGVSVEGNVLVTDGPLAACACRLARAKSSRVTMLQHADALRHPPSHPSPFSLCIFLPFFGSLALPFRRLRLHWLQPHAAARQLVRWAAVHVSRLLMREQGLVVVLESSSALNKACVFEIAFLLKRQLQLSLA